MPTYRTTCPHCRVGIKYNEKLFGQTRPCPNCRMPILLQAPREGDAVAPAPGNLSAPPAGQTPPVPPVPPPSAAMMTGPQQWAPDPMAEGGSAPPPIPAAAAPAAPPPPFEGPLMPERMKANRVLAGRVCPECKVPVDLGDEVHNCQQCGATMHLACHEKRGGCARCGPPGPVAFEGPLMPERMKANRVLVGRTCPECNVQIDLGDEVFNCQRCGATMHLGCHEKRGGCARCAPAPVAARAAAGPPPPPSMAQPLGVPGTVACRFCGEQIMSGSRKCRYCGEYQNEADRILMQRKTQATIGASKLEGYEIVIALIPCNLGCIWGIVLAAQGKPKGWKMLGINIAAQVVVIIVWALIAAASHNN